MELVDGETLGARLKRGKLSLGEVFDTAVALADALAAAHGQGITHRDLKPANVMISTAGRIKLLDFGVAKLRRHAAAGSELAAPLTEDGLVMGTVPYMSPEQVRGQEVDHRSDIFSLGTLRGPIQSPGPARRRASARRVALGFAVRRSRAAGYPG